MSRTSSRSKDRLAAAGGASGGAVGEVEVLLVRADELARREGFAAVHTGFLLLAILEGSTPGARLLRDLGADAARLATHVDRLARMNEGKGSDPALTDRAGKAVEVALRAIASMREGERPVADAVLEAIAADRSAIANRALQNHDLDPFHIRDRMVATASDAAAAATATSRASATAAGASPALAEGSDTDSSNSAQGAQPRLTPEQFAALSVDGDYATAGQRKPFHAEVRAGDLHIYSGWRFKKKEYDGEGNTVYFEKERLLREAVAFVRRHGEVELGPCGENKVPDPDTFEAFLRQFSINGNLASYLPAILEHHGALRLEKRGGNTGWAVAT